MTHLEIAAQQHPEFPDFSIDLGLAYRALGRETEAEARFGAGRRAAPTYAADQLDLAETLARQRKVPEAIEACRRGLLLFPDSAELLQRLADLCQQAQRWPEARSAWRDLLRVRPPSAGTSRAFGEACFQAGDFELAHESFQRAAELQPGLLSPLLNLGLTCQKLGRPEEAQEYFRRGLAMDPNHAQIHKVLGDCLRELGRWPEAIAAWHRAVELRPGYADAWHNLGLGFERVERLEEALACHDRVVQLRPGEADAHRYLGMIREDLGQIEPARAAYQEALRLQPNDPEIHWQMFSLRAALGEFPQAWLEHEWRWKIKGRTTPKRAFDVPAWDGGDLTNHTLLVYSEQGFGDTIQAVRYIRLVQERGARVLLWCPPELVALLGSVPGVSEVFSQLTKASVFDRHAPLLSLPLLFGTTLATIPRAVPYLRPPEHPGVARLLSRSPGLKVGLVWCGSLSQPHDRRPVPLATLTPLLHMEGLEFCSLQTGPSAADLPRVPSAERIVDLSPELTDFAATAAAIQRLDLVITIDTSVAHLAGALGKPVWVLLSFAPDWRWMRDRSDSPWYPTMRLFRQAGPGDWDEAVQRVVAALGEWRTEMNRNLSLKSWLGTGLAHHQAGRWSEAEGQYRRMLEVDPRNADALRFLGVLERQRGNGQAARSWLERAREVQPDSALILHDLGLVWAGLKRKDDAIEAYRRALELQPQFPEAHYNLGNAYYAAGQPAEAAVSYRRALEQQPDLADAHFNLGLLSSEAGQPERALEFYAATLNLAPHHSGALLSAGLAHKELGQWSQAEARFRSLMELEPDNSEARVNLGSVLGELARAAGRPDELQRAESLCAEVLESQPGLAQAWVNLGVIRQALGAVERAVACFRRALDLQPDNADARYNLGIAELLLGRFETGWENYEARWRTSNPVFAPRSFTQPAWTGQPLAGRTLLIHAEQGLGDAIQFVRYIPEVLRLGARVVLECPQSLTRLLASIQGVAAWVARGQPVPPCDYRIPLLSLPLHLRTVLSTIPKAVPYLKPPPGVRIRFTPTQPGRLFKVGIAWAGNPRHGSDPSRSLALTLLAPLFARSEIALYSLQVGPASQQLRDLPPAGPIADLSPQLTDFAITAAVIEQLDLLISVDTAVAHLAGALAKPVWVLLPLAPDWRWLLEREDSPWYPTMRLFRQKTHGDWAEVIQRVVEALREEIRSRPPSPS